TSPHGVALTKRRPGAAAGRLGARAAGADTRGRGTGRTTDSRRSGRTGGGSGGSWGDTARTALSRTTGGATGAVAASSLVAPELNTQAVATAPPTTTRPSTPMGTQRRRGTGRGSDGSSGSSSRSSSSPASGEPTRSYSAGAPPSNAATNSPTLANRSPGTGLIARSSARVTRGGTPLPVSRASLPERHACISAASAYWSASGPASPSAICSGAR